MKAVVLAAGEGTRLEPLTDVRPKPMLPVANRPLLDHVVEAVVAAGIEEILLVVGYKRERIQDHFGDGDDWGVDIEYAVQERQLGTGHAILQAEPHVDGGFLVLNGDRIIESSAVAGAIEAGEAPAVTVTRVDRPSDYGVVELSGDHVRSVVEKPAPGESPSELINAGVYRFDASIFDEIRDTETRGELAVTATLERLAVTDAVRAVRYDGDWLDVSYLWDLLTVNARVIDRREAPGVRPRPVHDDATVAGGAALHDSVRVGPNATVLPGTALGGNVEVGANAVLENVVVLPDATVGPGAVLRDCVVGANASVGPHVTAEGGYADVAVDGELYQGVRLGGVVGDNATVGGDATLEPGAVVGNGARVGPGAAVAGRIENGAVVRRG